MIKRLKEWLKYFFVGVLAVLPLFLTIQVVIFTKTILLELIEALYGRAEGYLLPSIFIGFSIALLIYIGHSLTQRQRSFILSIADWIVEKIPLLNTIHRISKKVVALFTSAPGEGQPKREVVLVEFPRRGMWVVAYVTNHIGNHAVVFIPTAPNPTSGFTVIVPESDLRPANLGINEAATFIISIGAEKPPLELPAADQSRSR